MKRTPLRLKLAYPEVVSVATDVDGNPEADYDVSCKLEIGQNQADSRMWRICLGVKFGGKPPDAPPHRGEVRYVGFFAVESDVADEKMERVIAVTAPSILYSSIREFLALLTGRGPMPCVMLPVVSFMDHDPKQIMAADEVTNDPGQNAPKSVVRESVKRRPAVKS